MKNGLTSPLSRCHDHWWQEDTSAICSWYQIDQLLQISPDVIWYPSSSAWKVPSRFICRVESVYPRPNCSEGGNNSTKKVLNAHSYRVPNYSSFRHSGQVTERIQLKLKGNDPSVRMVGRFMLRHKISYLGRIAFNNSVSLRGKCYSTRRRKKPLSDHISRVWKAFTSFSECEK